MPVATPVLEDVGGYAGVAHCYRLDPPLMGHDHVVVWVQDFATPEAVVVAAWSSGAAKVMNRLPGSYVHPVPTHAKALDLAGDYEIGPPDPPEPEPPVDPPVDPPTDPDPEPDPPVEPEPEVP